MKSYLSGILIGINVALIFFLGVKIKDLDKRMLDLDRNQARLELEVTWGIARFADSAQSLIDEMHVFLNRPGEPPIIFSPDRQETLLDPIEASSSTGVGGVPGSNPTSR